MKKLCVDCNTEKPITDFYVEKNSKDGKRANCKACKNKKTYSWRSRNADKYNKSMREYQAANPLRRDDCDLKRKYGVSRKWFEETLQSQNNTCAVCKKPNASQKRRLAVDHHHQSGTVRGILCYNCNRLLHAFDNIDLFKNIINYLKKYGHDPKV